LHIFLFYTVFLGLSPQSAVEAAIEQLETRLGGIGGCVAVNGKGEVGVHFNSNGMAWSLIKDNTIRYGLYKGEDNTKSLL
jgi:beta-aspartyl-peptidase (threonine type)